METTGVEYPPAATESGPAGNARLTTSVGLVLFVLLVIEAATTLSLRSYLSVHIFLGLLLLPPLALKLATTGWRFLRYYMRDARYTHEGPPRLLLRLLAPLLVASTLALFGSGVALIVVGHGGGWLLTLHAASFAVWGVLMIVHVVAYLRRTLRVGTADWGRQEGPDVAGGRRRRAALGGTLLLGVILALAAYPAQHFRSHRGDRGHREGRAPAEQALLRRTRG